MGDPVLIAPVRNYLGEPLGDAEPTLCLGEQHHAAIRRDPSAIKGGSDLLALNGWKRERQQIIVGHGGRWRAPIPAKGWLQQPNPTPDQKLTLPPPPQNPPLRE